MDQPKDMPHPVREDLFSLAFLKKSVFLGSYGGMRYRISKEDDELELCLYPEPYAYEYTPEESKRRERFPFSEEGYALLKNRLEEELE